MTFYDQLVAADKAQPQPAAANGPAFYDQLVRDEQEQGALRASVTTATQTAPETAAKRLALSKATGLPMTVVETAEGEAQALAKFQEIARAAQTSPLLKARLMDPQFTTLVQDDVGTLTSITDAVRKLLDSGGMKKEYAKAATATGNFLAESVKQIGMGATAGLGSALFDTSALVFDLGGAVTNGILPVNVLSQIAASQRATAQRARAAMDFFSDKQEGNVAQGVMSGMRSAGQNLALLPLGLQAAAMRGAATGGSIVAGAMSTGVGATAYTQARELGMGQIGSLTYAAPQAAFEYAFEKLPASRLLEDITKHSNLLTIVRNQIVPEMLGEQATTVLQDLNDWVRLNPDKTLREFIAERPDAAVQTAVATLVGIGVQGGTVRGLQRALGGVAEREARAREAELFASGMGDLLRIATGSKLRERDADTFAAFAQEAAQEAGFDGNVYVEGRVLAQALQQTGMTAEQLAELSPQAAQQIADATTTGDTVAIPVGDLVGKLNGTGLEQALLPHLRMTEDALSQEEAKLVTQQAQTELQQSVERVLAQAAETEKVTASRDAVRDKLLAQMNTVRRFTADVNSAYSKLVADFYAVTAARMGKTAEELYAQFPLTISDKRVGEVGVNQDGGTEAKTQPPKLLAVNNLTADNLLFASRMGGLAVPSIGVVTDKAGAVEGFGEITLIGTEKMANPRSEPVFSSDAYTARFPQPEWSKVKTKQADAVYAEIHPTAQEFDDSVDTTTYDSMVRNPDAGAVIEKWLYSNAIRAMFLRARGIEVAPVMRPVPRRSSLSDQSLRDLQDEYVLVRDKYRGQGSAALTDSPEYAAFAEQYANAVRRELAGEPFRRVEQMAEMSFADFDSIGYDLKNLGKREVDSWGTRKALDQAIEPFKAEFKTWVESKVLPVFGDPHITVGRKRVAYTLDNIVAVMTDSKVKSKEKTMTFGDGQVRATASKQFNDIEQMRQAAQQSIVDPEQYKAAKEETGKLLDAYRQAVSPYSTIRNWRGEVDTWEALDASMRALAKWAGGKKRDAAGLRASLRAEGFAVGSIPSDVIDQGVAAGNALLAAPVPYFEAKPQRAVALNEFAGAVIPENAASDVRNVLTSAGVPFTTYANEEQRAETVRRFAAELSTQQPGVLFQDAATMRQETRTERYVRRLLGNRTPDQLSPEERQQYDALMRDAAQEATGAKVVLGTYTPSALTISLLEQANLSTFLHETGHFFLDVTMRLASLPDAPADIKADADTLLRWFGIKGTEQVTDKTAVDTWLSMSLEEQTPYHEKFARAMEQYFFEGNAPSKELQPLFARFRAWLTSVYRSLQEFMADWRTGLTDEVREVMDRMIAAQEQIDEVQATRGFTPLFESIGESGMTIEQWEAYQRTSAEANDDALAKLQVRSLRDVRWVVNARVRALKAISKDVAEKRKAVEEEVTAEVRAMPVYAVQRWLKTGVLPDGTKTEGTKLSTEALVEMYGAGAAAPWRYIATNMLTNDLGLHPDVVAEMPEWSFSSGDEMVRAIIGAMPEAQMIDAMTNERMLQRYGDLFTPEGQARAAEEAIHNEARARMVATELAALRGALGKPKLMMAAAKQFAQRLIASRLVRDVKPAQHFAAETRAAKRAAEASAAGRTQEAITAKRDQLLNFYAAREAMAAEKEIEAGLKYLKKVSESKTLNPDYRDQIHTLLERFDLRRGTSLKEIERRKSLTAWLEEQRDIGVEPVLPPGLENEALRKSYKEMTVEEFRGLVDSIKQIEHLGRLKNKLLTAKGEREYNAVRDEMVASVLRYAGDRQADVRTPNTLSGQTLNSLKAFWATHIKVASWARVMDGGNDGGPMWEYLIRPANEAGDTEVVMREKATRDLTALLLPILKSGKMQGKGIYIDAIGRSMNREARLAVALNAGNESNLQRLMGGEGWTRAQVDAILATLTEQELQFVQQVWDYFESYRPLIAAKERRVTGVEPEWIEPAPLTVATADGKEVTLRGGYYPVKYDPRASSRAEAHDEAEAAKQQMRGAYTSATTRRGFTKSRVEEVNGRPLLYSLDGIYSGINEVIHDLAWHEFLIDANRLMRDDKLAAVIRQKYGPEVHQEIKRWLEDVAVGEVAAQRTAERALSWIRQGVSAAGIALNVMSALIQPLGITQSITRIGATHVGRGIAQYLGSPLKSADFIYERSDFMRTRSLTRFRELAEVRNRVKGQTAARRAVDQAAYVLMLRAQQVVDMPTWLGAYDKAIHEGNDEARAARLADQAVIDAQASGTVKDLAGIERGGPALKLFTVFYSFFNATLNNAVVKTMTADTPAKKAKLAADYLLLFTVPVILGELLKSALTPGDSGDNEEEVMRKLVGAQLGFLSNLMFGVREFGGAVQVATGTNPFGQDYSGPAGVRLITDTYKLAKQVNQGEMDDAFRKALINELGLLFRLPAAQINRTITGTEALLDGKTENPAAVVFGYEEPR